MSTVDGTVLSAAEVEALRKDYQRQFLRYAAPENATTRIAYLDAVEEAWEAYMVAFHAHCAANRQARKEATT
jgi:hypothetical protein